MCIIFLSLLIVNLFLHIVVLRILLWKRKQRESEYYTDYIYKNLVLRVYKPEFEYNAIGKVPIEKILDRGTLSQFYRWCLIEL